MKSKQTIARYSDFSGRRVGQPGTLYTVSTSSEADSGWGWTRLEGSFTYMCGTWARKIETARAARTSLLLVISPRAPSGVGQLQDILRAPKVITPRGRARQKLQLFLRPSLRSHTASFPSKSRGSPAFEAKK